MLKKHMKEQTDKLDKAYKEEKDTLDYIGLKEMRFEFNQADKQINGKEGSIQTF